MKKILLIVAILFVVVSAFLFVQTLIKNGFFGRTATVKLGKDTIHLEVANTEKKRELGLSNRKSLASDHGMIFVFDQPQTVSFWMKDMQFPLDMIFLNNTRVVTIYEDVPPPASPTEELPLYQPDEPADKVIEVPAGTAKKYNIKTGDTLSLSL